MNSFWLYIFCLEILCFSGGLRFIAIPQVTLVVWGITSGVLFYKGIIINKRWFSESIIIWLLMIWVLLSTLVVNEKNDNTFLKYIIFPMGMALAHSCLDFYKFRNALLKTANILLLISIIVHVGYNLDIIPSQEIIINDKPRIMSLYLFNVKWDIGSSVMFPITRFSSIYWEPGQCQIVIMYIIVLFSDVIKNKFHDFRFLLKHFGVLFLSIILTGSTTGYIVMALYIIAISFINNNKKTIVRQNVLYFIFAICSVYAFWTTDVVQGKLEQSDTKIEATSLSIRMADNVACFNVTIQNPIFGLGVNSKELNRRLLQEGDTTSSNGWLFSSAQLGFVYLILLFTSMYIQIRKMQLCIPPFMLLIILIISQANEAATYFPYMWLYGCPYGSYCKTKL